jgi:NAD(P)-dependent dehydrogenase (short-subunit alcohol dehydrogenase family)
VVVITGATSGLGQAFAVFVAAQGAHVIAVGRDGARLAETVAQITAAGGRAEGVQGDVSTRAGIRAVAQAIAAQAPRVDVLVNNAGGTFATATRTADGIETTVALNTLGPWMLAQALHGPLSATHGRVVNVATGFLDSYPVDPDDLASPKKYGGMGQYARAKHALVMLTAEQATRWTADGITVVSMNPGIVMGTRFGGGQSRFAQAIGGPIMRMLGLACDLDEAMRRFSVAAFGDVPSGAYVTKGVASELPKQARDPAIRQRVVALIEGLAAG